jgi:glyoxylase-like metal-dependent hydrolase (beta-lactamase superfamily II)
MRGAVARSLRQAVVYRLAGTSALRHLARVTGAAGRMGAMSDIDGMGTERARCVLAPNPSPMTLDGTNTWILAEPGSEQAIVVDPGPKDGEHLRRVADTVAAQGRRVGLVLLTHGHPDHAAGAKKFAGLAGGPAVRALDPKHRLGEEGLAEGEVIALGGLEVRVLETPGHSDDSLSFWIPADSAILTGDTVLGYGSTVIEGSLGDYLDSLERLREFAGEAEARTILPGHGPKLDDPTGALDHYLRHRRERLAQVEAAVTAGARTPREVVERVYADVDRSLWPAAEWSVSAQLDYLRERGGTGG